MKLRTVLTSIFILSCVAGSFAQPKKSRASGAHLEAHRHQLANVGKQRIDSKIISDIIIDDIKKREDADGLTAESSAMIDDLLKEARTHIGKRYRHGAKGPSAFDCSGFSSYVYRQFGYSISPSSRQQYTQGTPVAKNELRKGDLVFFTSRSSGKNVGHVGIVVTADNDKGTFTFIHASIKGVKISNYEGYYLNRYVGAKRIINN